LLELGRTPYFVARYCARTGLLVLTRTAVHYPSVDEMLRSFEGIKRAITPVPRARTNLLVDSRESPSRNDPEFERALALHRRDVVRGFAKVLILVKTAAGRLQAMRYMKEDGTSMGLCSDVGEAGAYLSVELDDELLRVWD